MKKVLATCLCLLGVIATLAQGVQIKPTTEEEYNYVTKGYRVQIESGLDMKKGYSVTDMGQPTTIGNYTYQFKVLLREEKQEVAALMAITKSSVSGKIYYFCIPLQNQELYTRYWNDVAAWDAEILRPYCYLTSTLLANLLANAQETDKQSKK